MVPTAQTAWGLCESKLIHLLGFCCPNCFKVASPSSRDSDPHLLISIPCSWTLCVSSALTKELREASPEAGMPGRLPAPSAMYPDIKVSPESGGACEGGWTAHPRAQIWILLLFSPFHVGDREGRRRGKKPLKKRLLLHLFSPTPLPWRTS